jgi:hypothetical protein
MKYKVIDNFLEKTFFDKFKNLLFSEEFTWFFKEHMTDLNQDDSFFAHCFYNDNVPKSIFFKDFIPPIIKKLNIASIVEIRANLNLNKNKKYSSRFHVDRIYKCKTAILYLNTCNGYTEIEYNKKLIKINSVENRILIFDSNTVHRGVNQTDTERRIVLNMNYFSK